MDSFKNCLSLAAGVATLVLTLALPVHSQQTATASSAIGASSNGGNAMEFLVRSDQDGPTVTHYGYLTHISGLPDELLFSNPGLRTEATARFTLFATTKLDARHELGNIIVTAAPGTMTLYFNQNPGGDFNDPHSFATGKPIATYSVRYHNVLTVLAPNTGIATASAEIFQLTADRFTLDGRRLRLGRYGLRERLFATGQGTRTQADPVKAFFHLGGYITVTGP